MTKKAILIQKITFITISLQIVNIAETSNSTQDLCVSQSAVGGSLSFVHFNACSLNANFENICNYLESLNIAFDIIATLLLHCI